MTQTATCEYCSTVFETEREYCPTCGKQVPKETKATLVIEQFEPDCGQCHGTCCKALAFDWPHYKKLAGEPCKNLDEDFKCRIWEQLEQEGYTECRSYTCFGAGQTVAKLFEEQHPETWHSDAHIQNAEMAIFQKVYAGIHADILKQEVPVGNIDDLIQPSADKDNPE